jgi:hypothetical protein
MPSKEADYPISVEFSSLFFSSHQLFFEKNFNKTKNKKKKTSFLLNDRFICYKAFYRKTKESQLHLKNRIFDLFAIWTEMDSTQM